MNDMIKITIGLIATMLANILLGAKLANLKNEFSWNLFWAGIFKYGCIIAAIFLMYLCSYLNPDILVAEIGGISVNLITGMKTLFVSGIALYGYQDLSKLAKLLKVKVDVNEKKQDSPVYLDREDE